MNYPTPDQLKKMGEDLEIYFKHVDKRLHVLYLGAEFGIQWALDNLTQTQVADEK